MILLMDIVRVVIILLFKMIGQETEITLLFTSLAPLD